MMGHVANRDWVHKLQLLRVKYFDPVEARIAEIHAVARFIGPVIAAPQDRRGPSAERAEKRTVPRMATTMTIEIPNSIGCSKAIVKICTG